MKFTDLIPGGIYYTVTDYEWVFRFKKVTESHILGESVIDVRDNNRFSLNYGNPIYRHKEIRVATEREKELLITEERNRNYKPKSYFLNYDIY